MKEANARTAVYSWNLRWLGGTYEAPPIRTSGHAGRHVDAPGPLVVNCGHDEQYPFPGLLYVFAGHFTGSEASLHAWPDGHMHCSGDTLPRTETGATAGQSVQTAAPLAEE